MPVLKSIVDYNTFMSETNSNDPEENVFFDHPTKLQYAVPSRSAAVCFPLGENLAQYVILVMHFPASPSDG
jgi:hypothetical protein